MDSFEWIFRELDGAAAQNKMRALEQSAHAPHPRSGGPLDHYTFEELEERLAAARAVPVQDRERAWRKRFNYEKQLERDAYPLEYIEKHLSGCREFARLVLRDEELAAAAHERACTGSWAVEVTSRRSGWPAPTAGRGSTIAAFWSGASWWPGHASQRRAASRFFGNGSSPALDFKKEPL